MNSRLLFVSATAIMVAAFAWAGCSSDESEDGAAGAAGAGKGGAAGSVNKGGSAGSVNKGGSAGEAGQAQGGAAGAGEGGAAGGSAGTGTGGSAGGSTDCTGILSPNDCATCIETNCCPELAACSTAECIECASKGTACDSTNQAQADALKACLTAGCETECGGGEPPVTVEPACDAPATAASAGSCVTVGGDVECNPVTSAECTDTGAACDVSQTGYTCYPDGNTEALCAPCGDADGYCQAGLTCVPTATGNQCAKYCCTDADCGTGTCDKVTLVDYFPGVGICVKGTNPPADAGPEAATPDAAVDAPAAD